MQAQVMLLQLLLVALLTLQTLVLEVSHQAQSRFAPLVALEVVLMPVSPLPVETQRALWQKQS